MGDYALQLNPPIELETPKGRGLCHFLSMSGSETGPHWCVFQEDGQVWWWDNHEVRAVRNVSYGRVAPEKPERRKLP